MESTTISFIVIKTVQYRTPDTENGTCIPCEANCANCQDRPDHCTSCEHHLVMHENRCYAACPKYTYETMDYSCEACHPSCETCNGTGQTQCVSCRPGFYYSEGDINKMIKSHPLYTRVFNP